MSASQKPRLLIIGGGFAGITLAQKSSAFAEVTLVEPKGYLELTWATVRSIVDPKTAARACFSYTDIPNIGTHIQATVTSLTSKEATLSTGQVVSFDYAAICSGSTYSESFKSESAVTQQQRLEALKAIYERIKAAKSIVVVGGGPAGVETASEIVEAFAGKEVTLVHPGKMLLSALPPKAGALAKKWLEGHKVKVLLETSVGSKPEGLGPATIDLKGAGAGSGSLTADIVLWCAGGRPATGFLAGDLAACREDRGLIKVMPTLQVEGQPHLFALGDCNNVPEAKVGFLATKHAELAAKSLQALASAAASGGKAPKLGAWKPSMGTPMMMVSLGRGDGVCRMGGSVCGGFLPANIKSKGLFVEQYRTQLKVGKAQ